MKLTHVTRNGLCAFAWALMSMLMAAGSAQATYTPDQIRTAYGVNQTSFNGVAADGSGQTVAIVLWGDDSSIVTNDSATFSSRYNLPQFNTGNGPTLTFVNQSGGSSLPGSGSETGEYDIDTQWVHAIAPKANIVVVEADDAYASEVDAAVTTAKNLPGVSVVSMSFGFNWNDYLDVYYNPPYGTFNQPANHSPVAFVAGSGDNKSGYTGLLYPAANPGVIAAGGTSLTLDSSNHRIAETVWNNTTDGTGGSGSTGAGVWTDVGKPSYQASVLPQYNGRIAPDLSFLADPYKGVDLVENGIDLSDYYSNKYGPNSPYGTGGTSLSAPCLAAMMALVDQGRALNGLEPLSSTDALNMMYGLIGTPYYKDAFYDVTDGSSNGYDAGVGYDAVSGLGTPNFDFLVPYLAGDGVPEPSSLALLGIGGLTSLRRRRNQVSLSH